METKFFKAIVENGVERFIIFFPVSFLLKVGWKTDLYRRGFCFLEEPEELEEANKFSSRILLSPSPFVIRGINCLPLPLPLPLRFVIRGTLAMPLAMPLALPFLTVLTKEGLLLLTCAISATGTASTRSFANAATGTASMRSFGTGANGFSPDI